MRWCVSVTLLAVALALLPPGGFAQNNSKNNNKKSPWDDPDAIGNRDVGKGVNFYSLDKEIALGKQLA